MARSQVELDAVLKDLEGVKATYFQPDQNISMEYPAVVYERSSSFKRHADNAIHFFKKRYTVTVVDRMPDSPIPDQVENLPYATFDRFFRANGLNHFVFQLYF